MLSEVYKLQRLYGVFFLYQINHGFAFVILELLIFGDTMLHHVVIWKQIKCRQLDRYCIQLFIVKLLCSVYMCLGSLVCHLTWQNAN